MKKIAALVCSLVMAFTAAAPASAYLAGQRTMDVSLSEAEITVNSNYENQTLNIGTGGRAVYKLYVPFAAISVDFVYAPSGQDASLSVMLDSYEYSLTLPTGEETEKTATLSLSPNLKMGEHQVIIKSDSDISLKAVTFNKENVYTEAKNGNYSTEPNLTAYEKAIATAVILSNESPVIMVNGGRRYVDNDNPRLTPYTEGGDIYLPLHSFARAFGLYLEEKDDEFALVKASYSFHYKNGTLTIRHYSADPVVISNISKKIDGQFYMPLKYVAELEGKVLERKGSIWVVDYPSNVKEIFKDVYYNELCENYSKVALEAKTGKTYYVSTDCEACDDNDGSFEKPFKTIARACEIAEAGDTVIIRGGIYHETIAPKNSGTASNPIVFKAYEGEKVQLSACAELGEPIGEENGMLIYTALADLGDGRNQIFYKSENLTTARHPNENTSKNQIPLPDTLSDLWPIQGNIKIDPDDVMIASSDTDLDQPEGYWDGATIVTLTGWAWSLGTAKVKHSEPGKLYLEDPCKQWWFTPTDMGYIFETDYSYLTDHVNAIDMPGEWAYKDGKIYIMPPEGETAETLKLEQKVRQVVVDLSNNAFVRIEGIDTYGGGMTLKNSEMCMLRDGTYRYICHYSHGMDQREGYIDERDLDNPNGAPPRGEMGIYLGGRDNIVINNTIDNSAAAGIYSCGLYEYIENNTLNDCGYMGSYVGGIFVGTQGWEDPTTPRGGNAIFHNTVYNVGRHAYGVCTHEAWYLVYKQGMEGTAEEINTLPPFLPDEVAYNDFHEGSLTARDTGTFYLYGCVMGTDELRSRHHNNLIYNSWGWEGPMNAGLYYDGYSSQIDSYENVIFASDDRISYKQPIYQQEASYAKSMTFLWNNTQYNYVEGGKDGLSVSDYPGGRIFMAGSSAYNEGNTTPYIDNMEAETDFLSVSDGIISDGAVIENGLFDAQKNGEYICFKDVDFDGGKKNQLGLNFVADRCNLGDSVTIIIGDSLTNYYTKETVKILNSAQYEWGVEQTNVNLVALPEKSNIYIRVDDLKSFKLASIKLSSVESPMSGAKLSLYADAGEVVAGAAEARQAPAGETHYYLNNTWGTTVLKFDNVKLAYECNEFLFKAASAYEYRFQPIELYAVPVSEDVKFESVEKFEERGLVPIVSTNIVNEKWEDFSLANVPCDNVIKPGTYNFYLVFRDGAKSTNFFWCGLGQQSETDNSAEALTSAEAE